MIAGWEGVKMRLRILLVEDYEDCAAMSAAVLQQFGHFVRVVRTGSDALDACHDAAPRLVLLDIGLPGMSGYEVAKQIRTELCLATPFIIAITGFGRANDHELSSAAGINMQLVKPADLFELNAILAGIEPTAE